MRSDEPASNARFRRVRGVGGYDVYGFNCDHRDTVVVSVSQEVIDPGIVDVVTALHDDGWKTTDSGDGSKYGFMEGALPYEHVAIDLDGYPWLTEHAAEELLFLLKVVRPGQTWAVSREIVTTLDSGSPRHEEQNIVILSRIDQ